MKLDYTAINKPTSIKFMKHASKNKIEETPKIALHGTNS